MRRYSAARVSLEDVAKVRREFDVTVNDVALAAITDSFRAALVRRGERPRRDSLRTLIPVSIRAKDAMAITDNRVSLMLHSCRSRRKTQCNNFARCIAD